MTELELLARKSFAAVAQKCFGNQKADSHKDLNANFGGCAIYIVFGSTQLGYYSKSIFDARLFLSKTNRLQSYIINET